MGRLSKEGSKKRELAVLSYILRNGVQHRMLETSYLSFGKALGLAHEQIRSSCYRLQKKECIIIVPQFNSNGGQRENAFVITDTGINYVKRLASEYVDFAPAE